MFLRPISPYQQPLPDDASSRLFQPTFPCPTSFWRIIQPIVTSSLGGSRRKVATSRKSAHSRQKQYFEQRKRQKQSPRSEHCPNESDMEVLYNDEPRSLDILNMINLAVASKPDDSSLGLVTGSYPTIVEGTRLMEGAKSSNSYLPQGSQTDSYKCASHMNKLKMPGSGSEHSSSCPVSTLNEINENPRIECTILDLLDDGSFSNGRSIPEAHVALLVEDNFGYFKRQLIDESYMTLLPDQKISFEGYSVLNSRANEFEIYETSDLEVPDTFPGSSRNLWEGSSKFEDSETSTPYLRRSTLKREISPSFIWDSNTNAEGSLLPAEDYRDNTSPLSYNLNSSAAAREKSSLGFGTCSLKPGKINAKFSEKFQKVPEDGSFMGLCSEDDIFEDAIWGEKQNINSAFKIYGVENIFLLDQTFPPKTSSMLDFNSFAPRKKSMASCGYEAMTQDDHFDPLVTSKTKFKTLSGCEPPGDFIYPRDISSKWSDCDLNSHVQTKGHVQYSSSGGGGFYKEIHFNHLPKYQDYNEERGSSGKPQRNERPTSSGNAESVAGVASLGIVTEHNHSRNKIAEPSKCLGVEKVMDEAEVIPAMMEELPTQIQNYVQSILNQFQGRSPVSSHPSNEESKATHEPETKRFQTEGGGNGDTSYQFMLQSYALQLLCVQKVLLEASGKDIKKRA